MNGDRIARPARIESMLRCRQVVRFFLAPRLSSCTVGLAASLFFGSVLQAQDAAEIVRRSVERDWTDYASVKDYTYCERTDFRRFAKDGQLSASRKETHEILILDDRPYARLVARDDRPLPEADARREQEKLDRETEKREHESAAQRSAEEKQRAQDRQFIREIPDAFVFRVTGVENISNQAAWVIDADPKPGYHAVNSRANVFSKVRARIWIEQATYHWVKVDAQVIDSLGFDLGLLRVEPGGQLHFEQTRVNNEIWLPSSIVVRADARLALIKKIRAEYDIRYSGYKKFQSDSRIVSDLTK